MEIEGEKYYREQAELNKNNNLNTVMLLLADDERYHADILRNKLNELSYELKDNNTLEASKSVFAGMTDFKSNIKELPHQIDFYRMVLEKEKESIELYKSLLSKATDEKSKNLFQYLIEQEENHYFVIDELIIMLRHADEWVEDAEFGLRKEY